MLFRSCRVGTGESGIVLCGGMELRLTLALFMGMGGWDRWAEDLKTKRKYVQRPGENGSGGTEKINWYLI